MRVFHNQEADLTLLTNRQIPIIGYGKQGRAQDPNLCDSGLDVIIDNREDKYAEHVRS